jgi:hypothetical protein
MVTSNWFKVARGQLRVILTTEERRKLWSQSLCRVDLNKLFTIPKGTKRVRFNVYKAPRPEAVCFSVITRKLRGRSEYVLTTKNPNREEKFTHIMTGIWKGDSEYASFSKLKLAPTSEEAQAKIDAIGANLWNDTTANEYAAAEFKAGKKVYIEMELG